MTLDSNKWKKIVPWAVLLFIISVQFYRDTKIKNENARSTCIEKFEKIYYPDRNPVDVSALCNCLIEQTSKGEIAINTARVCGEKYIMPPCTHECEIEYNTKGKNLNCMCYCSRIGELGFQNKRSITLEKSEKFQNKIIEECKIKTGGN